MNIKAFLLFLTLLTSGGLNAQLLIGPEGGANLSWASFGDKDLNSEYRLKPVVGYNIGGHVGFRVRKRFFLHISVLYSTKGRITEGKNEFLNNKIRLNYIDLPIIYTVDFKGKIGHSKEFKYNLGIGPVISYWLGGKGVIENSDTHEFHNGNDIRQHYNIVFNRPNFGTQDNEMTIQSYNKIQLGLNLTASLIFEPVTHRHIMLTLRYEIGGSYLSKTSSGHFAPTTYDEPLATKNRGLRLSVAYLLDMRTDQRKRGKSTYDRRRK